MNSEGHSGCLRPATCQRNYSQHNSGKSTSAQSFRWLRCREQYKSTKGSVSYNNQRSSSSDSIPKIKQGGPSSYSFRHLPNKARPVLSKRAYKKRCVHRRNIRTNDSWPYNTELMSKGFFWEVELNPIMYPIEYYITRIF